MKRRIITIAVSFLLCIGMVGAGFAAWIIAAPTAETKAGEIVVENVSVTNIELTYAWKDTGKTGDTTDDAKIVFGKHTTDTCEWLTNDSITEKLSATLIITVSNHKELIESGFTYSFDFNLEATGNTSGYTSAVTDKLIKDLPTIEKVTVQVPDDGAIIPETMTYEIEIEFGWGEAFGEMNPISYYSDKAYANYADEAETKLKNLYTYLNGVGYQFTINGKLTTN